MTKLPSPEQWVLSRMDERECAELIEQHIDFYVESDDGFRRSVHLPTEFVRHYRQRHDGALPTVVAVATAPLVLADGTYWHLMASTATAASSASFRRSCGQSFLAASNARRKP